MFILLGFQEDYVDNDRCKYAIVFLYQHFWWRVFSSNCHNLILIIIIIIIMNTITIVSWPFLPSTPSSYDFPSGVLNDVQEYFSINNSQAGLLQTSFIVSYMLLSPIFGYLGDRHNRKYSMVFGISLWSVVTLLGSFVPPDVGYFVIVGNVGGIWMLSLLSVQRITRGSSISR